MKKLLATAIFLLVALPLLATHLKGGHIRMDHLDGYTYRITLTIFTNTINTNVLVGGEDDWLDFGDGTVEQIMEQPNTLVAGLEQGVGIVKVSKVHTYPGPGRYLVSYRELARNFGIINIDYPADGAKFMIESEFTIDNSRPGFHSPDFLSLPDFSTSLGKPYRYAIGGSHATDALIYGFVHPKSVHGYHRPDPMMIDPFTGVIDWDTQYNGEFTSGEFLIAVMVRQYHNGVYTGMTTLDLSISVEEMQGEPNTFLITTPAEEPNRVYVAEGETVKLQAFLPKGNLLNQMKFIVETDAGENVLVDQYDSIRDNQVVGTIGLLELSNARGTRKTPFVIHLRAGVIDDGWSTAYYNHWDHVILFFTENLRPEDLLPDITAVDPDEIKAEVIAFPNPFSDRITFKGSFDRAALRIINLRGSIILERTIRQNDEIAIEQSTDRVLIAEICLENQKRYFAKIVRE